MSPAKDSPELRGRCSRRARGRPRAVTTRQWNREATASGIEDAVRLSTLVVREDSPLKIMPIPLLIALKLYAGGHKSKADIIELLVRNPDLELDEVRSACARYGLGGLEELIVE